MHANLFLSSYLVCFYRKAIENARQPFFVFIFGLFL